MTVEEIRVILAELAARHGGPPHRGRSDNGPEFAADAVRSWLEATGSGALYVAPASPGGTVTRCNARQNNDHRPRCLFVQVDSVDDTGA
jgi:hypothetical protein